MGFPQVAGTNSNQDTSSDTTQTVNLPASISSGDLLIIISRPDGAGGGNWPQTVASGFTTLETNAAGSGAGIYIAYKVATGSEGGSITFESENAVKSASESYRITNYSDVPQSAEATSTSGEPNPPSLEPGWGAQDILWIIAASKNTNSALTEPASYGNAISVSTPDNGSVLISARQELNASSEDPGTFTGDPVNVNWAAYTIAILTDVPDLNINVNDTVTVAEDINPNIVNDISVNDTVSIVENINVTTIYDVFQHGDWYDLSWKYRIKLTVNASQVDADLTNYPAYVDLSDLPTHFHDNVNSDGGDIRVTESDGITELPREVVFYTAASDTGELHFLVNGTLSSSVDTDFYIYYGNSGASDYARDATYGLENVWNSNYKGVWHLQEAVNNDSNGYKDSTANVNHGTGSSMAITAPSGQLAGSGQAFDGASDVITCVENGTLDITSEITLSFWFDLDGNSVDNAFPRPIGKGQTGSSDGTYGVFVTDVTGGADDIGFRFSDGATGYDARDTAISNYNDGNYHYSVSTYSDSGDFHRLYHDGVNEIDTTRSGSLTITTTDDAFTIGATVNGATGRHWNGKIDEVRVLATALSGTWISTEYNNQNSPSTFYSVGEIQHPGEVITVTESITVELISNDLDLSVFDAVTVAENIETALENFFSVFDAITLTENVNANEVHTVSIFDAITITENVSITLIDDINVFDAITVTENIAITLINTINVFDAITLTENLTITNTDLGGINVNEAITTTESVTITNDSLSGINVFDAITVNENVNTTLVFNVDMQNKYVRGIKIWS